MKPFYEDIGSKKGTQSFLAYQLDVPMFEFKWHYHPEYELTLIIAGSGKRLVGDSHENFGPGDLVLIGPSMPHTWVSDPSSADCSAIVIQFPAAFISAFLSFPEFKKLADLLELSARGLYFPGKPDLQEALCRLPASTGPEKIVQLLSILEQLSQQQPVILASQNFTPVTGGENETRINKVCRYVQRNIDRKISLDEVAGLVSLSEAAFCKFFRRATGKTFSDYVNDVRISRACALLTGSDQPIGTIAYSCGFENLAYFNRIFLKKKSINPKAFRQNFFRFISAQTSEKPVD
jgi:AraC-like DNA-binding protein